ncbi:DNA/RNA helicase domain-containing protein [Saccharothrix sp. HUAS TT1]|uniref:DNA/RNA helicase domain-containing protein n=1 Tax=unclassified Saccharothrix TaxID=2593673 RepID=UPI00345C60D3
MALVRRSAQNLLDMSDRLHTVLEEQARIQFESGVAPAEVRSWQNSLPAFLTDVVEAGLGHVEVLLEHKLPHNPKRVDVILCGTHPRRGTPSYVLVELKQWSSAEPVGDDLVQVPHYPEPVLHPVEQVRRYCEYLVDSTPALAEQPGAVHGLAYLHNALESGVWRLLQYEVDDYGRLYTMDTRSRMADRLRTLLDPDPTSRDAASRAAEHLLNARHAPSKPLLDLAAREIQDREQFVLLDEQQVAYSAVMQAVERARTSRTQTVVIVLGGPGSGKSVIALSLLGELARLNRRVYHATGSSAFTSTLRKLAGRRSPRVQSMFKYFNSFMDAEPRGLDVLICDEAHRVRETSVNRYTKAEARQRARRQVTELIDAALVPVFLLDEHQVVRPGEMGSKQQIEAAARALGCEVEVVHLAGQYRCGGSEFFDTWSAGLLGIGRRRATAWSDLVTRDDEDFVVRAAPTPAAVEEWLLAQQARFGGTARLAAGYCWKWSDPTTVDGTKVLVPDVRIGDWQRPWNAKPGKRVPDAPESHYWASDERGFGQVGCVYTAQGFEYDWAGVIIGPDFVRRDGRWVARREHSHDPAVKSATDANFHELIRNTYKVLLTRGMRGMCVCSTDPETQDYLETMAR